MTVSIVIPAYNASHTIEIVLSALTKQSHSDFEVIVVDDASTDDTIVKAENFCERLDLKLYQVDENLGRARIRNYGVEKSSGDIVLLLDSDIETIPTYVSTHVALHDREPRAVGVGALRYPPYLAKRALAKYYSSRGGARLKTGEALPGKAFVSCLASFPRSLFDEISGFHSGFRVYGGEDLELGLRLAKNDVALTYLPTAIGYHHHLRTIKEVVDTLEQYGESGIPQVLDLHPEFAQEMYLDDLHAGESSVHSKFRQAAAHPIFFYPALKLATLFEFTHLPSPLISYLIYRSYRQGYYRHLRSVT